MTQFNPNDVKAAALTPRWAALSQLGAVAADLHNYDVFLVREPRLLVPVDVQAMVVRSGVNDTEGMQRLPFRDGATDLPAFDVHDGGTPRSPGVYLLWSAPAALGRGRIVADPDAPDDPTRRRLALPPLPDRWLVLRLAVPTGAHDPTVTGWVVAADAGTVTALADWPTGKAVPLDSHVIAPDQLNVHSGGPAWTLAFDAALGRLGFYDDLADLAGTSLEGDAISYVVCGWWSVSGNDPLDGVGTDVAYRQRLAELGWNDPDHPSTDTDQRAHRDERTRVAQTFGLQAAERYARPATETAAAQVGAPIDRAAVSTTIGSTVSSIAEPLQIARSGFLEQVDAAMFLAPAPTRTTLLHGRIHGIPLSGTLAPESRPAPDALRVVLGSSTPDVAATVTVAGTDMGAADQDARRGAERLLAAFASGDLVRLGDSDVWADVDEYEHAHGFISQAGGIEAVDRFLDKPAATADPGGGARVTPTTSKAALAANQAPPAMLAATVLWSAAERPMVASVVSKLSRDIGHFDGTSGTVPPPAPATPREVPRPAPRFDQPAAAVVGIAGGGRVLSAVEREEADGALVCRLSDQTTTGHAGILPADELLTTLGSAAVPDEALALAREALAEDPYLVSWRASRTKQTTIDPNLAFVRFRSEAALAHAYYTADDARLGQYVGVDVSGAASRQKAVEALARGSLSDGVWSHPEGVTMWGQPWRPLFCDWEVTLSLASVGDTMTAWTLGGTDLDSAPDSPLSTPDTRTFQGRSPLVAGVARTIAAGIDRWLTEERQRDIGGHGLADAATEQALASLRDTLARIDLMSVALDGVREQLLGLRYDRGLLHTDTDALADGTRRAMVQDLPRLIAAGALTLTGARLVDAFGRVLTLPVDQVLVPQRLAQADHSMLYRPRITPPARWRFDLVAADAVDLAAPIARVDQVDPAKQVNPVAGFLLPDHIDESLEVFAADGRPLGELSHDAYSDAVMWEIAPGRTDVAPAAGPNDDPDPTHRRVGWIASGLVAADATIRQGTPSRAETESPLSAMLRAIDTTLWSVDPFGSLGVEHIAGLVGRPIAVVNARLSLDVQSDVDQRAYPDDGGALHDGRQAAYDALARQVFEVRLGEVTRADDGLLGYFVDDDYSVFHLVDRVIADEALPSGRCRGVLDVDNPTPMTPVPIDPDHPYIDTSGVVRLRFGQTVKLTLLMHPGGKVHITSGVLPRSHRDLARDWVQPGLSVMAPSLRCGPLLIDADKVRLPKVASFPAEQLFTHRDTATSWKDDPILAATQAALLPDTRPEVQEGWIRIAPNPDTKGATG